MRAEQDGSNTNTVNGRTFLNANRRLVPNSAETDHEYMEEGTSVDAEGESVALSNVNHK